MKKTTKLIVMSVLTVALCVSLISGATFALFTSESNVNISVTSGKVKVSSSVSGLTGFSLDKDEITDGQFTVGGTYEYDGAGTLALNRIVPGDGVNFTVDIANESNVNIKYQIRIKGTGDATLVSHIKLTIDGEALASTGTTYATDWTAKAVGEGVDPISVRLELPVDDVDCQDKSATFTVGVYAVQGNANTPEIDGAAALIFSVDDFMAFASLVNNGTDFAGQTAKLMQDVDFAEPSKVSTIAFALADAPAVAWTPIGNAEHAFKGTFDGNGFTIYNFTATAKAGEKVGLFGHVEGAVIENVHFANAVVTAEQGAAAGVLVGQANGLTVSGVTVTDSTVQFTDELGEIVDAKPANGGLFGESTGELSVSETESQVDNGNGVPFDSVWSEQGEPESSYVITNADDLVAFAAEVATGNDFAAQTVKLKNDIDLTGVELTPIGTEEVPFKGVFSGAKGDGENYVLSNISLEAQADNKAIGLFAYTQGATLTSFVIDGIRIVNFKAPSQSIAIGAVVGFAKNGSADKAEISNIQLKGLVDFVGAGYGVGGICGHASGVNFSDITISADPESLICYSVYQYGKPGQQDYNKTSCSSFRVGGVVGWSDYCNYADIETNLDVLGKSGGIGGVVGLSVYSQNFERIKVTSTIRATYPEGSQGDTDNAGGNRVGGVVGCILGSAVALQDVKFDGSIATLGDWNKDYTEMLPDSVTKIFDSTLYNGLLGTAAPGLKSTIKSSTSHLTLAEGYVLHAEWNESGSTTVNTCEISSANGLLAWATDKASKSGASYSQKAKLMNSISLKGIEWTSPSVGANTYFDGNNCTISDIVCKTDDVNGVWRSGLFGSFHGTIKNLTIRNVTAKGAQAGALIGHTSGVLLDNVTVEGIINITYDAAYKGESFHAVGVICGIAADGSIKSGSKVTVAADCVVALNQLGIEENRDASFLSKYAASNQLVLGWAATDKVPAINEYITVEQGAEIVYDGE